MAFDEHSNNCTAHDDDFSQELYLSFLNYINPPPVDSPSSDVSGAVATAANNDIGRMNEAGDNGVGDLPSTTGSYDQLVHCSSSSKDQFKRKAKGKRKDKDRMRRSKWKRERAPVASGDFGRGDHILRERQRRDDLSNKFGKLETFLPSKPKRDRTAIVDDAINYVKEMQGTLARLEREIENRECKQNVKEMQVPFSQRSPSWGIHNCLYQAEEAASASAPTIHVRSDRSTGQITITIEISSTWCSRLRRGGFMTRLMMAMEELRLDVCHCNYSNMAPHIMCILVAKQRPWLPQPTLQKIVAVLQYL